MGNAESLTSLMIVVSLAFLVPILLHKLKLKIIPIVVAEIIVGIVLGKSGFHVAVDDKWLQLTSLFGFIYLMFLSGLEINFSSFRRPKTKTTSASPGFNPFAVAFTVFLGILLVSYLLSMLLDWLDFIQEPYLMTLMIATISLGVVVPVLKENKMTETPLGQVILLITVISDFITMILLALYISLRSENAAHMLLVLVFFAFVFIVYRFIKRFAHGKLFAVLSEGTAQIGTRAIFALILLFVVMSSTLGVESILGAFLAGVIVSSLSPSKEFLHQLDSFGYGFLIPIFFVNVGAKMELWSLLSDPKVLVLIPLLLFIIFVSKMIPVMMLKKWFTWRQTVTSGVLLSSTLSLVIAISAIAVDLKMISEQLSGALVLMAVLSSLIFPVIFNRYTQKEEQKKTSVAIVGANHISLPVSKDLLQEGYDTQLYTTSAKTDDTESLKNGRYPVVEVASLGVETLSCTELFQTDIIVLATMDDQTNIDLARHAKSCGVEHIIVRVEDPEQMKSVQQEGFMVFSTLYAARTLLKAFIENPSAVRLIAQDEHSIKEVVMKNAAYHDRFLRQLPNLGDVLVLRIYRGESFIIPHGNTLIKLGDRLLVSGSADQIVILKQEID